MEGSERQGGFVELKAAGEKEGGRECVKRTTKGEVKKRLNRRYVCVYRVFRVFRMFLCVWDQCSRTNVK